MAQAPFHPFRITPGLTDLRTDKGFTNPPKAHPNPQTPANPRPYPRSMDTCPKSSNLGLIFADRRIEVEGHRHL